jgi:hypothetical protein
MMSPYGDTTGDEGMSMNRKRLRVVASRIVSGAAIALALVLPTSYAADRLEKAGPRAWKFGSEIDALPYAMNGYYGSVFAGRSNWRFRGVAARSSTPSFMVTNGFRDKRTEAAAFLVDRFFGRGGRNLEGLWIGGGAEHWRNRIRTDESAEYTRYNNFVLTAGAGYVWKLSRHLYLNPWAGGHFVAAGKRTIRVSGKAYEQPLFTPEFSVKFGFTF